MFAAIRLAMATHLGNYYDTSRFANTYVSTMRGPESPIYLLGARMLAGLRVLAVHPGKRV